MKTLSYTFAAGQRISVNGLGNYFHLLESSSGVDVDFMRAGSVYATAKNMEYGFFAKPADGFDELAFTSAAAQTIKIAVGVGDGGYNRTTGAVTILERQGAFTQPQFSLTNANQTLRAADANAKYVMVQNNDALQTMRVTFDGNPATATKGFRVPPGGYIELIGYQASGAINARMEAATGAANNVEVMHG